MALHEVCGRLLPSHASLHLDTIAMEDQDLPLDVTVTAPQATCPDGTQPSTYVHSHYRRTLTDLPWATIPVTLHLRVRRFWCAPPFCRRQTFTERVPQVASYYIRDIARMTALQTSTGWHSGARGARNLARRGVRQLQYTAGARRAGAMATPGRVPWASTIGPNGKGLLWYDRGDLDRQCPVELLEDRTAETVATWLPVHPEVTVMARDRAEAYASGVTQGVPDAVQVADRWHLMKHLREAVEAELLHVQRWRGVLTPRQLLRFHTRDATVGAHNRDPLGPRHADIVRDRQHPRRPRLTHVLASPVRRCRHRPPASPAAPPSGRAAATAAAQPDRRRARRPDSRTSPNPIPAPAMHAKDRHDTRDTCSTQRQRIKSALAHPQRSGTCLQRGGVEAAFLPWQMVVALRLGDLLCCFYRTPVEVDQASIRHRIGKDHADATPVAGGMRPGAWRCIAHTILHRQGQGNAPLLQVRVAAAAGQRGLEGGKLLRKVWASGSRRTRRWSACRWRARGGGSIPVAYERWDHAQAALAQWRQRQGRARWQPRGLGGAGSNA